MLKHEHKIIYLENRLELANIIGVPTDPVYNFVRMSQCHRLVSVALLLRYYKNEEAQGITCMYNVIPFSPETIRRAVKDGIELDVIKVENGGDKRYKKIKASQELVDTFEKNHVESYT